MQSHQERSQQEEARDKALLDASKDKLKERLEAKPLIK